MRWIESEETKETRRRVGRQIRRFLGVFNRRPTGGYEVTDEELVEGRAKAQQLLTSFALTVGVSELCMQFSSLFSIWKTMLVGFDRDFYSVPALLPYEGGAAAGRMYGGALLHSVLCIPSTFVLVGIALYHVEHDLIMRLREKFNRQGKMIVKLNEYYEEKEGRPTDRPPTEEERAKDRQMAQRTRPARRTGLCTPRFVLIHRRFQNPGSTLLTINLSSTLCSRYILRSFALSSSVGGRSVGRPSFSS